MCVGVGGGGMQGIIYLGFNNPVQCPPMFGTGKNVCVVETPPVPFFFINDLYYLENHNIS